VLRRIDRILAPVTWAAAALVVVALIAGPALIGAKTDEPAVEPAAAGAADAKATFADSCGSCHTLARAGTDGTVGPNLDERKPDAAKVEATVRSGKGTMPAFEGTLSDAEIKAVAAFVAGEEPAAPTATATATADAAPAEPTTVRTGRGPDGITLVNERVWVTNASAGTLQRFDAADGRALGKPLAVGRAPDNPVVAGAAVWVALGGEDAVARVAAGRVTRIPVGDAPEDLAVAGDSVWVTNAGDGTVMRIDRTTARVIGPPIEVGGRPLGIAAGSGTVWVSSFDDGTVWRLDASTGARRGEPVRVGAKPRGVAVGGGSAWVANSGGDSVTRLRDGRTIDVGDNPRDLVVEGGSVWVANAEDDTVTRIDAESGEVVGEPFEVGDDPTGVAAGGGAVWTANFRDDTLSRVPVP
jgi:DNA-binding beta-propeller fold protein YncE/mono/diheme cytochrome c family protein